LRALAADDETLHRALRRKFATELVYYERSKPSIRKGIKARKRAEQAGKCALCCADLPQRGAVLDRFEAMAGCTPKNS
jgi:hypothetical protein